MMQIDRQSLAQDCSELTLYDDLSEFIKIFNRILSQVDAIIHLIIRREDCSLQLRIIREMLLSHNQLIDNYHFELDQISSHRNTYLRFMSRLLENVVSFKKRGGSSNPVAVSLAQFLTRTQKLIHTQREEGNIGQTFRKIFSFVAKFCKECETLMQKDSQVSSAFVQKEEEEPRPKEEPRKKMSGIQSQTNFQRMIVGLNRRFATVSCLDVDYASFKSLFFQSRTQSSELFEQIFERNRFIFRQITKYSKDFQQFLKRKQKSFLVRKNRFNKVRASLGDNFNYDPNSTINKQTISIDTRYNQKNSNTETSLLFNRAKCRNGGENGSNSLQKQIALNNRDIEIERTNPRKTSYQLKNVYISLNDSNNYVAPRPPQISYINDPLINEQKFQIKARRIQSLKPNQLQQQVFNPALETKTCEVNNIEFGNSYGQSSEVKGSFLSKINNSKKYISERKNIRIAQYTKSLNGSNFKQDQSRQRPVRTVKN